MCWSVDDAHADGFMCGLFFSLFCLYCVMLVLQEGKKNSMNNLSLMDSKSWMDKLFLCIDKILLLLEE